MSEQPSLVCFYCPRCDRFITETCSHAEVFCPDCGIWFDSEGNIETPKKAKNSRHCS